MKYRAVAFLDELGEFDTFEEAFVPIYDAIKEATGITWQEIETTVWIVKVNDDGSSMNFPDNIATTFYAARDIMCEQGLLTDGYLHKENIG